jgi:hypothetical protein
VGEVAYKLALPAGSHIHDVFHMSCLRKCLGSVVPVSQELPLVSVTSTILSQPELVLDHRVICKGQYRPKKEVLIKWKSAAVEDAT